MNTHGEEQLVDAEAAARAARLHYVSDEEPGYTRRPQGRGFSYLDEGGERVSDKELRARFEGLAIPPAWHEIWICPSPNGHIQAVGRDDAGRKQYIYHPKWREVRDRAKFEHLISFGEVLPPLRRRLKRDLGKDTLDKGKVTAAIIKLMDRTLIRIGNRTYANKNNSYGLTTLHEKHVDVAGEEINLKFKGKGGTEHEISLHNDRLARVVRDCQEIPGYELFKYQDESGQKHIIDSSDVNAYLSEITGRDVTAKDFRTWGGTVLAAEWLYELGGAETKTETKHKLSEAVKAVAEALGNTPAICQQSYIHPAVLEGYSASQFIPSYEKALSKTRKSRPSELRLYEAAVLEFLKANTDSGKFPNK